MSEMQEKMDSLAGVEDSQIWATHFAQWVADHPDVNLDDIVSWFENAMTTARAVQWREDQRDLIGTQEMLGQVLRAVGGRVVVTQEALTRGHSAGSRIVIEEDLASSSFIFKLEETEVE